MKKWNIIILIMFFCLPIVSALDFCTDTPNSECVFITPKINCSNYNYTIYQKNGSIVEINNLTSWGTNIYSLNFSYPAGDYLIELCEGTTREVFVGDKEMTWTALILITVAFAIFHFVMFKQITLKELRLLKVFFLFMFVLTGFSTGIIPFVMVNNSGDISSVGFIALVYLLITLIGVFLFSYNWLIKIILNGFRDVDNKAKAVKGDSSGGKFL